MNQHILELTIKAQGYTVADAKALRPTDIIEGVLALRRAGERRVLALERMTAAEAAIRLAEVANEGWSPVRWLRIGPPRPITAHLGFSRAVPA